MSDTRIPNQVCPHCGYKMDETTHAFGNERPKAGDYSMCLSCGAMSVFNADLTVRVPNAEEAREISLYPQVIEAQLVRASTVGDKIRARNQ